MRKVTIEIKATVVIYMKDDVEIDSVLGLCEFDIADTEIGAWIDDFQIEDYEIKDSK